MNRKDRDGLIGGVFVAGLVALFAVVYFNVKFINPYWIGVIALVYQFVYAMPRIHKYYLQLHELESSKVVRYIPILNEITLFSTVYSTITMIGGGICVLLVMIGLAPMANITFFTPMIAAIFGDQLAMDYTFYCMLLALTVYALLNVVRGMGFAELLREVNRQHAEYFGKLGGGPIGNTFEGIIYIALFIPLIRVLSFGFIGDRVHKMVSLNDIRNMKDTEFVEGELN